MRPERKSKAPMVWTIIIGLVMVLSVIGFLYTPSGNAPENYNGYKIVQGGDGYYYVTVDGKQARFSYHPNQMTAEADQSAIESLKNKPMIFITFNPNEEKDILTGIDLARFDLTNDLGTYFNTVSVQATTLNTPSYNLPVATCANATATQPVIEMKSGNSTSISAEGSCIILEAQSGQEFMMLKDRIIYGMFGIIR